MLLEFSVSNYLSFREKQTLSMIATPRLQKKTNVFPAPVNGEKLPDLLKVAVIYGPNASGKSNFLNALGLVDRIASRPAEVSRDYLIDTAPFRFDSNLRGEPSVFELHFLSGGCRYEFLLEVTRERIVRERLTAYPNGKEQLIYDRQHLNGVDHYDTTGLEGGEAVHEAWQRLTPPGSLFISQAVASSSEQLTQLRRPYGWLAKSLWSVGRSRIANIAESSLKLSRDSVHLANDLAAFLRDVDVPVMKIHVAPESPPEASNLDTIDFVSTMQRLGRDANNRPRPVSARRSAVFTHKTELGEAEFRFFEESEGTQNLVGFWLPWTTRQPSVGNDICILAVDEMDSSLHPSIVANLVKKHIEAASPSQLIFTTHDTHLMDSGLLRRDQIWITERDSNGATQLRSVHDFQGREGEDIEKRYYEGRYRGLPLVRG